jgi:hypothetical protein
MRHRQIFHLLLTFTPFLLSAFPVYGDASVFAAS